MKIPGSPYLLLVLTTLFWSGNFVLGRGVHNLIPPVSLVFWRWAGALLILLPFALQHLRSDWPIIRKNLLLLVIYAFLGVTCFNTFVYIALQSTTATNAILINSIIPVLIVALSCLFAGTSVSMRQLLGMVISFTGVVTIICRADLGILLSLRVNSGDFWVLLAVICWACYTVLLRHRPEGLHPLSFLTTIVFLGLLGLVPVYVWELGRGLYMVQGFKTAASLCYVTLFPSVLAFIFWNQAVGQVGANKAGLFLHLMPVFGTVLSIIFLGEALQLFQVAGIGLIFSGIWLTTAT
jgi:drug/metabolite transporter (DMT)-like permease